jgi:proteasome lid subunit RPN8/RPN11
MPIHLDAEQEHAIRVHGERDYPHECCGFLIGTPAMSDAGTGETTVARTRHAANTRTDSAHNRFEIDPGELMRVDREARAEGLGVVGFYHSHPDAPARPSNYDREHAWPGYCYVIVSVADGQAREMFNWLLREDRSGFDPDEIVVRT